jgi:ABC-type cobalamin/Fe3+-siderophores transport system ATPase subunit
MVPGSRLSCDLLIGLLRRRAASCSSAGEAWSRGRGGAIAREVGFVPQGEESVFPMTVREVVAMGRYPHLAHGAPRRRRIAGWCGTRWRTSTRSPSPTGPFST